jgi:hypothetical protein
MATEMFGVSMLRSVVGIKCACLAYDPGRKKGDPEPGVQERAGIVVL